MVGGAAVIETNRIKPRPQVLQPRTNGMKYTQRLELIYSSGLLNAAPGQLRIANHYNFLDTDEFPPPTGRMLFTVEDAYWQGNKLQIQQVRAGDPLGLGMDLTDDGGVWSNWHNYACKSINSGGYRDFIVRVNGADLDFDDVLELVTMKFPTAA